MSGGMSAWILDKTFRANLKVVLIGGGEPWVMAPTVEPDPNRRDVAYLDQGFCYFTKIQDYKFYVKSISEAGKLPF